MRREIPPVSAKFAGPKGLLSASGVSVGVAGITSLALALPGRKLFTRNGNPEETVT
jgi:hypothetical protein